MTGNQNSPTAPSEPSAVNDSAQLILKNSIVATFVKTWTEPPRVHILTNVATNYRSRRCAEPGNQVLAILMVVVLLWWIPSMSLAAEQQNVDVLVFGATPAGIAASIGAAQDGCTVLLVEPTHRIGGLVTSGLSHTDFHSRESLSGAFFNFARQVESYYSKTYGPDSKQVKDSFGGTFAEPKVNLLVFEKMLERLTNITVLRNHRLTSVETVESDDAMRTIRNVMVTGKDGKSLQIECKIAIDGSYEGDLMAMAGTEWRVGREGRDEYQESLAPEKADDQLQAYNFRFVMTQDPKNRVIPEAPADYRREDFIGVLEPIRSGKILKVFDYPSRCIFKAQTPPLPNGKYDINDVSQNIVRLSLPGLNRGWPNGSDDDRQKIFNEHRRDQLGLLYFLQNDEAVPEPFRKEAQEWGMCRDEFKETNHLPPQLYVREARRMVGKHVYAQRDSEHAPNDARATLHIDSIAMGDYGNNCHGTDHEGPRFGGKHTGEFYNPVPPYQIPYGVLVPRDINNLLVPTAVSSTHVGFCALRLEPVWMSLGQASGHAAAQSIQRRVSVQDVAVRRLQYRLHSVGAATIYVSDVLPKHADFAAVQWWGTLGGLHGLAPMPAKPGQRGRNLHGQYFEASPGHTAELDTLLDAKTSQRWQAIATLAGFREDQISIVSDAKTRGDFIRKLYFAGIDSGITASLSKLPRFNVNAKPNSHPPGEIDNLSLMKKVVFDATKLLGIVVDDSDATLTGQWQCSSHTPPYVGLGYLHDMKGEKGSKSATYTPSIPEEGQYEVRVSHCYNVRRATNATITIHHADGESTTQINQQETPEHSGLFRSIGTYRFTKGRVGWVRISNEATDDKYVIADAVQFLPTK